MHRVVVLAVPGVVPFELAIPARLFGAALDAEGAPLYKVTTCTIDGAPVRTADDYAIAVEHDASALRTADTVVIPPSRDPAVFNDDGILPPELHTALTTIPPGTRVMAICTGSFMLAAAGLLQGRVVTTHWREATRMKRVFPQLTVDADVLFIDDGDILTSAGVTAGVDLCLHAIRRDHGSEIANEAARSCVVPPWRDGGQAQYIRHPVPEPAHASTAQAREWALNHLDEPLSLRQLAAQAQMSVRTFTRHFRDEVGLSPGQWLTRQRLEHARLLLESSNLTIDQIAEHAGFGTTASLRQHFTATTGTSPHAYRRTFHTTDTATPRQSA